MTQADTNRTKLRFSRETAWGETPGGPAMTEARITSETLGHQKGTVISEEIRSDRQRTALLEVSLSADGDFGYELSYGSFELFLETALRGTISSATVSSASVTLAASTIAFPAGTDLVAAFAAGQFIKLNSAESTQGGTVAQIASLTSTVLTVTGTTMVASVLTSANVTGRTLLNGTTKTSFLLESDFEDLSAVKYFTGQRINTMSMGAVAEQIVTGVFSFLGKEGTAASTTISSATTSSNTNTPMTSAVNVTDIFESGQSLTDAVQSFSFNIANNMRARPKVGSKTGAEPGDGGLDVSGTANLYFERIALYQKFIAHTETSLAMRLKDSDGNFVVVSMPAVFFSAGNPSATGQDADVFLPLDFSAIKDGTLGYTIRMDFLPA